MTANYETPFSPGLGWYVDKINADERYTFIRLGDGEHSAITGDRQRTSSGSQALNIKALQRGMRKVITRAPNSDKYILSIRRTSFRGRHGIKTWLDNNTPPHVTFHDCTVFYKASKKGQLYPFIKALRDLDVPIVMVGPERLRKLHKRVFPIAHFIQIPGRDCFVQKDRILYQCMSVHQPSCFLLTAGPAAKVMAWELHQKRGQDSWILDLGSLWDIYVGKATRTYMKGMRKKPAIIRRNLTGK